MPRFVIAAAKVAVVAAVVASVVAAPGPSCKWTVINEDVTGFGTGTHFAA